MRVLGLSSGTSVDAIDAAVAEFRVEGDTIRLIPCGAREFAWDPGLRDEILAVAAERACSVADLCRLHAAVGDAFGAAAAVMSADTGDVDLVASHGQTMYHWVEADRCRATLQIGDPARIYAAAGVPVVSDLRAADVVAGGQGAPLASTLDALWLGDRPTAALNLGGIANVTVVGVPEVVCGDTGPANCLIDAAMVARGQRCDLDGAAAARGRVDAAALSRLLDDPYFALPFPKSTGREYFDAGYVARRLGEDAPAGDDLIATLTELTAASVADALAGYGVERVVVSGGGARNPELMRRLGDRLGAPLVPAVRLGLPDDAKEAYLFALLGFLAVHGWPGTVAARDGRAVTGAARPVVLGSLTPPSDSRPGRPARLVVEGSSS